MCRTKVIKAWKAEWGFFTDDYYPPDTRPRTDPGRLAGGSRDDFGVSYEKRIDVRGLPTDDRTGPPQSLVHDDAPVVPYDPLSQPFAQSVVRHIRDRWAIDRTAAADQITGLAYTKQRQAALLDLTKGHYLASQFGLRTIHQQTRHSDTGGIRIVHDAGSPYLRDDPGEGVEKLFESLFTKTFPEEEFERDRMFFVNSDSIPDRLTALYGPDMGCPVRMQAIRAVGKGLFVMVFETPLTGKPPKSRDIKIKTWAEYFQKHHLHSVGAMPSSYDAIKLSAEVSDKIKPLNDPALKGKAQPNAKMLREMTGGHGFDTIAQLFEDFPEHPMRDMMGAGFSVVSGLQACLQTIAVEGGDFDTNVIVSSAMSSLTRLIDMMPAYLNDAPRLNRLFDLMIDEVYLLLAACKPYDSDDFKKAATETLCKRAPVIKTLCDKEGVTADSFMLGSGMDALSSAIVLGMDFLGVKLVDLVDRSDPKNASKFTSNYFEIEGGLLNDDRLSNAASPIVIATLNPSTPVDSMAEDAPTGWGVGDVIKQIGARLENVGTTLESPLMAIIDITVEKGEDELQKLFTAFADQIAEGVLVIVTCKSYQKYPSLGSGKILAGGMSVVGKGEFCETLTGQLGVLETEGGAHEREENQLCTHFLMQADSFEKPLLNRAAKNAKFAADMFNDGDNPEKTYFSDGLPFLVIPGGKIDVDAVDTSRRRFTKKALPPMEMLWKVGVEERMSFGFNATSCLPMPGGMRIALGQESEGELVEKLFVVGKLSKEPRSFDRTGVAKGRQEAFKGAFKQEDLGNWTVGKNELDSKKMEDEVVADLMGQLLASPEFLTSTFDPEALEEEIRSEIRTKLNGKVTKIAQLRSKYNSAMTQASKVAAKYMKTGVSVDDIYGIASDAAARGASDAILLLSSDMDDNPEAWRARTIKILRQIGLPGITPEEIETLDDDTLKDELNKLSLAKGEEESHIQALTRQLKLVKACQGHSGLSPEAFGSDNPTLMATTAKPDYHGLSPDPESMELKYLQNICASCAMMTLALFDDEANQPHATEMTDLLLEAGMDQISPEARELMLTKRIEALGKIPLHEIGSIPDNLDLIETCIAALPYREGAAQLFVDGLPDAAFDEEGVMASPGIDRLVATLMRPLSLHNAILLFERLVNERKAVKAHACTRYLQPKITAAEREEWEELSAAQKHSTETITPPSEAVTETEPLPISVEEIHAIQELFLRVQDKLLSL